MRRLRLWCELRLRGYKTFAMPIVVETSSGPWVCYGRFRDGSWGGEPKHVVRVLEAVAFEGLRDEHDDDFEHEPQPVTARHIREIQNGTAYQLPYPQRGVLPTFGIERR